MNSILATILAFIIALSFLRVMDFIAHRGWIESRLSRKLIHIGIGPVFVVCWLMFPDVSSSRWLAALVPFTITAQFALVGLGIMKDEAAVKAMSRTGDPKELLRGPLFYGIMIVLMTVVFWKDSPTGMTALLIMCGGDGVADLIGRWVKSPNLPWSPNKTLAGSISVFFGSWFFSASVLAIYVGTGVFAAPIGVYVMPLTVISLVSTLVESLPFKDVDNITVTLVAAVLGYFLF